MNLEVKEENIPQANAFSTAYLQNDAAVASFFHYSPYQQESYVERLKELRERSFPRHELVEVIKQSQQKWGSLTVESEKQLERLAKKDSVVVIGGQQAGLLLGPLYTLYKAITIIQVAKQQEEQLGIPVIPIFWIAGEDHDFQEINHVYIPRREGAYVDKHSVNDHEQRKLSASHHLLPKDEVREWLNHYFSELPHTEFSDSLYQSMERMLQDSETYVDFFAKIMSTFFAKYGLLLIDSADRSFRELQTDVFLRIIENYDDIDLHVRQSMTNMQELNYTPQVTVGENPALLFIYENEERLLIEKVDGHFQTKNEQYQYSVESLKGIAQKTPWKLSNNVITRPFMQESLFPTLAFVSGPGEIAYWALYKSYFEQFELKLPVMVPRTSITLIEKPIAKVLMKREVALSAVFNDFQAYRQQWLKEQDNLGLEQSFEEVKDQLTKIYQPVLDKIESIEPGLKQLGEKNRNKIIEQIEYLEKRSISAQTAQHDAALRQFDKLEQALIPQGSWQERIYNPFTFFNKHGMLLMEKLMQHPYDINGLHKIIYLQTK